jgi:lipoprotein-releasing system permease protein
MVPDRKKAGFFGERLITEPFVISGIYQLTPDVEKKYVYIPIDRWRGVLKTGENTVSFLDILVSDSANVNEVKQRLKTELSPGFVVKDRLELNLAVLKMLNMENAFTYVVGLLFLVIAVFNIVGSIIILVLKKKKDRFVMAALGLELKDIRKIFFYYGNLLILGSGLLGLLLGSILVVLQKKFGFVNVPGTYLVYPVEIRWENYLIVFISLVAVAFISSYLASLAVNKNGNHFN